jgi:hypothetical protein
LLGGELRAGEAAENPRDTLVYQDGDRVQGRLVQKTPTEIVFKADRFGELRVPAAAAVVIKAERPAGESAAERAKAESGAEREKGSGGTNAEHLSVSLLTAKLRDLFGLWHGRLALSTETATALTRIDRGRLTGIDQLR